MYPVHVLEEDALDELDPGEEERAHQPGDGADERRVKQHPAEDLKLDGRALGRDQPKERRHPPHRWSRQA